MTFLKLCSNPSISLNLQSASKQFARSLIQSPTFSTSLHDDGHEKSGNDIVKVGHDQQNNRRVSPFDGPHARDLGYILNDSEYGDFDKVAFPKKCAKSEWKAKEWMFLPEDNKPVYQGVAWKLGYRIYGDGFQKF